MNIKFDNKVAIVTGAGGGIGKQHALEFARRGAKVVVNDLGGAVDGSGGASDAANAVVEEIKAEGGEAIANGSSVADKEGVSKMVAETMERWGRIDVLVNNAAGNFVTPAAAMSENAWRAVIDIVLDGTFRVSKACYPLLRKSEEGSSIVNIIANYAWGAAPFVAHSGAAKAGVLNLTRSLALEWSNDKIRVNAMCPGVVLTDNVKKNLMLDENVVKTFESNIPAGGITKKQKMPQQVLKLS